MNIALNVVIFTVQSYDDHQYITYALCHLFLSFTSHFPISPLSPLASPHAHPSLPSSRRGSASKGRALPVECIALSSGLPRFRDTALTLHQEKDSTDFESRERRPFTPRLFRPFSPVYEVTTAVLSMGTVVQSQVRKLFPAKCQEN